MRFPCRRVRPPVVRCRRAAGPERGVAKRRTLWPARMTARGPRCSPVPAEGRPLRIVRLEWPFKPSELPKPLGPRRDADRIPDVVGKDKIRKTTCMHSGSWMFFRQRRAAEFRTTRWSEMGVAVSDRNGQVPNAGTQTAVELWRG